MDCWISLSPGAVVTVSVFQSRIECSSRLCADCRVVLRWVAILPYGSSQMSLVPADELRAALSWVVTVGGVPATLLDLSHVSCMSLKSPPYTTNGCPTALRGSEKEKRKEITRNPQRQGYTRCV